MRYATSLVAGAYAVLALASLVALRNISGLLEEAARYSGLIVDFWPGVVAAARWPTVAAWIAVLATVAAMLTLRRTADRSSHTGWLAVIAILAGVASVLTFRAAVRFVTTAILPGGVATPVSEVVPRLTLASVIAAICFVVALAAAIAAFPSRAALRFAMIVLVVSLGVSASLAVTLRSFSAQYQVFTKRNLDRLR
jgi:hypothetical protein